MKQGVRIDGIGKHFKKGPGVSKELAKITGKFPPPSELSSLSRLDRLEADTILYHLPFFVLFGCVEKHKFYKCHLLSPLWFTLNISKVSTGHITILLQL